MGLVIHRREGEGIVVDGPATITVGRIGGQVRLIIHAAPEVKILRAELTPRDTDNGTHIAPAARTHSLDE